MQPFIHIHTHSQYSLLDGMATIPDIVDKAIADGMKGVAITDHGNMFGIKELHDYCNKKNSSIKDAIKALENDTKENPENAEKNAAEIEELKEKRFKPIFGCEMYVAQGSLYTKEDKNDRGYHLIVLAKNLNGYKNLIKLVSKAFTDGFYSHPRTDKEELQKYHEDLIVCSACIGGEVPRLILNGQIKEARETVQWFANLFGDDYYLELQRHKPTSPTGAQDTFPKQQEVNKVLMQFAEEMNIKMICTNDVHFVNESDAEAHERLVCLNTRRTLNDPNRRMSYTKQEWFKTQAEMNEIFYDVPQALANTLDILNKVEFYSIEHGPILPNFPLPEGFTDNNDYLRHLVFEGAKKRWGELDEKHTEQLNFELDTIKNMGFPGYFLIVQDFIAAARKIGVSVGPGRGSAAGSAVAYCLGITQIDPIKYELLFESFRNPDRISLPDIDIDFDDDGRAKVLEYVTQKYGAEKVAHIITYGTMAAKMAISDVARVEDLPLSESRRLSKMIPTKPNDMPMDPVKNKPYKITIKNCREHIAEFGKEWQNPDPLVVDTVKYAEQLEGTVRSTGVHACGVIIGRDDITDWVPVSVARDKDGTQLLVTQYEGSVIESTGLIKMDFLGLKTLSIIKDAIANIKNTHGVEIDIDNIPLDDELTYKLYCAGKTVGTFQFESAGMQKYLIELQPTTFEDLIAMNALYRPGPMDYIPDFIKRKKDPSLITYDIPEMETYLKDTYGITVYQEQVMLLSRLLAGFTRGESDGLRKAMGKKLIDKMNSLKKKFMQGGTERGHNEKVLDKIWHDWEKFASYAFNKSHATCYSWVAFQTAYLKAHYPAEYMAAVLSRSGDLEKITKFMDESKSMGIAIKGPDINESFSNFSATKKGDIRFGLGGMKGIGAKVVEAIVEERNANGPFSSIFDFVERVNLRAVNRSAIETLAIAGAFDCFPEIKREDFFVLDNRGNTFTETLVRYGQHFQDDKDKQTISLFGDIEELQLPKPPIPKGEPWDQLVKLEKEREIVGMHISAHPLDQYFIEIQYGCNTHLSDLKDLEQIKETILDKEITFGGIVTDDYTVKQTKTGKEYIIVKFEDYTGSTEQFIFDNVDQAKQVCKKGSSIFVTAVYEKKWKSSDKISFSIRAISPLESMKGRSLKNIEIDLNSNEITKNVIDSLSAFCTQSSDNLCDLYFKVKDENSGKFLRAMSRKKMPVTKELIEFLKEEQLDFAINV